ncbi:MAG: AraC family transcriptional regulator [Rhodospirillales bacterium]|jgi:AraC-like DNA-binding protein|nr:AraC family transcriptional regulator [Rhodospirillales bacterium]
MADALSDVLRVVRLEGGVFLHAEFSEPWCIVSQATPEDCGPLLTGVEHIILYHYVVEGRMFVQIADGPPVAVNARQAVVLPRNDEHRMGSDLSRPATDSHEIISPATDGGLAEIHYGGGGARTRVICGFLGCQHCGVNPLITALPALLHLDTQQGAAAEWIRVSFEFAAGEIAAGRAGSDTVLAKLSEVLFVEAVRHHIEALPADQTGWLAGLRDPYVARALALIHGRLSEPWTVDELAREACISRSAFAERFTRQIGEPPMHYLARWRLQVAAHRLRQSQDAVARIGYDVGYESEAAFARAFRRHFGVPPAAWRKSRGTAAAG